jgi:TonB-linked SusC/RagA family outer membrane protein
MKHVLLLSRHGSLLLLLLFGIVSMGAGQTKIIVRGKVTEAQTGKPLAGASVVEVNANDRQVSGASTDEDGSYVLRVSDTKDSIRIAFIGFETRTELIGSRTRINMTLSSDVGKSMDIVVVSNTERVSTGFVTTSKRDLTGAVSSIKSTVIAEEPVTSIDQMIQGRAAGVQVVSSSGDPGAGVDIRIRGASSVSSGNDPLYIVDGIPIISTPFDNTNAAATSVARINPIADINPNDIERIDILKDANASAIYGARAANGVIIITTKRGRKGVTNITFNSQFGLQDAPPAIPVLNGSQYKVMRLEAEQNNGNINPLNSAIQPLLNDPSYQLYWYYQSDTKWLPYLLQKGFSQNYNLSVSGGGEALKYNFSTSFTDRQGSFINTGNTRMTGRFNLDYKVSNKLRFSANIYFARSKVNNYANYGQGSVYYLALTKAPNMPVYDVDLVTGKPLSDYLSVGGIQGGMDNPVAFAKTVTNDAFSTNLKPNVRVEYDIIKGLKFTNNTSLDFVGENGFLYLPAVATGLIWNDANFNRIDTRDFERTQTIVDNLLTYTRSFKGDLYRTVFLLGNTFNTFNSNQFVESGYANPSSQIQTLSGPARIRSLQSVNSTENILSFFAKANVVYNDRLGFDVTVRRDGSSKFGGSHKYGMFPSVGAYWRVSSEPYIRDNYKFVSNLKLRASWGQLGNSGIPNYAYISQFTAGANYLGYNGIYQTNAQLNNLRWETVEQTNLGMDLELFDSRVNVTADVYNKDTKNLLYNLGLPASSGIAGYTGSTGFVGSIYTNLGNIRNRGVELDVSIDVFRPKKQSDFAWNISFNIARNTNKVLKLPGGTLTFSDSYAGFTSQVKQGDPLGTYYGLTYKGVYATDADATVKDAKGNKVYQADGTTPKVMVIGAENGYQFKGGDAIYEDYNHDGIIDDQDKVLIGNANPTFFGGFNNSIDYKNFGIRLFIQFQYGNDVINGMKYYLERMTGTDNQAVSVLRRWRKQGDITNIPRALRTDTRNSLPSSRWVEDGSYARLKFVTFTYRIPNKTVQRIRLKSADLFLTANNLFTWTNYTGADPEIAIGSNPAFIGVDQGLTPQTRGYTLGLNVRF